MPRRCRHLPDGLLQCGLELIQSAIIRDCRISATSPLLRAASSDRTFEFAWLSSIVVLSDVIWPMTIAWTPEAEAGSDPSSARRLCAKGVSRRSDSLHHLGLALGEHTHALQHLLLGKPDRLHVAQFDGDELAEVLQAIGEQLRCTFHDALRDKVATAAYARHTGYGQRNFKDRLPLG